LRAFFTPPQRGTSDVKGPENTSEGARAHDVNVRFGNFGDFNLLAVASLGLSCAAFITGALTAIPGVICGFIALAQIREKPDSAGWGLAVAGIAVGAAVLAFLVIVLLLVSFLAVAV